MENESNPLLDIINTLSQKLDTNQNENKTQDPEQTQKDQSKDINIIDLINNLGLTNNNQEISKPKEGNNFDLNSILKMQKLVTAFTKEDPRKNLLYELKPFLRQSRRSKINQYITYFSIISALGIFDNKKE